MRLRHENQSVKAAEFSSPAYFENNTKYIHAYEVKTRSLLPKKSGKFGSQSALNS